MNFIYINIKKADCRTSAFDVMALKNFYFCQYNRNNHTDHHRNSDD